MLGEAIAAVLVGIAGVLLVLQPLFRSYGGVGRPDEPLDPEETPRGVALTALKEIDFDRETGKLSDADYEFLKAKYTTLALEALRAEQSASSANQQSCRTCGPRPEPDAVFCSTCGLHLSASSTAEPASSVEKQRSAPAPLPSNPLQAS